MYVLFHSIVPLSTDTNDYLKLFFFIKFLLNFISREFHPKNYHIKIYEDQFQNFAKIFMKIIQIRPVHTYVRGITFQRNLWMKIIGGWGSYLRCILLPAIDQKLCTPVIIAIITNYD